MTYSPMKVKTLIGEIWFPGKMEGPMVVPMTFEDAEAACAILKDHRSCVEVKREREQMLAAADRTRELLAAENRRLAAEIEELIIERNSWKSQYESMRTCEDIVFKDADNLRRELASLRIKQQFVSESLDAARRLAHQVQGEADTYRNERDGAVSDLAVKLQRYQDHMRRAGESHEAVRQMYISARLEIEALQRARSAGKDHTSVSAADLGDRLRTLKSDGLEFYP